MKERPILFSGPMVRAILDGRKTQTRRPVKMPKSVNPVALGSMMQRASELGPLPGSAFGEPGDRLWVRETFDLDQPAFPDESDKSRVLYRADHDPQHWGYFRWRPSIHMPRWASRIDLEVVSVRVERLQSISEDDARAEGVERTCVMCGT